MSKKTLTDLAVEYSDKIFDSLPDPINPGYVKRVVIAAYREGYIKAKKQAYNQAIDDVNKLINNHEEEVYIGVVDDILKLKNKNK